MVSRSVLIIFSADLTFCCSLFVSCWMADPNQKMMEVQRTDLNWISSAWVKVVFPELTQDIDSQLGLLDDSVDAGLSLQVLGDCRSQKSEGFHSQQSAGSIVKGGSGGVSSWSPLLSPQFWACSVPGCCDCTSCSTSCLPVCRLLSFSDKAKDCYVVYKFQELNR